DARTPAAHRGRAGARGGAGDGRRRRLPEERQQRLGGGRQPGEHRLPGRAGARRGAGQGLRRHQDPGAGPRPAGRRRLPAGHQLRRGHRDVRPGRRSGPDRLLTRAAARPATAFGGRSGGRCETRTAAGSRDKVLSHLVGAGARTWRGDVVDGTETGRADRAAADGDASGLAALARAICRTAPEPINVQIARAVRERIATGAWPAHYKLPAEPDLARALGVNRGTVRKALAGLIEEGLLVQSRGRGTFVTSGKAEPGIAQRLRSLSEDFRAQGVEVGTEVLSVRLERLPLAVQALLNVPANTPGLRLVRVFRGAE